MQRMRTLRRTLVATGLALALTATACGPSDDAVALAPPAPEADGTEGPAPEPETSDAAVPPDEALGARFEPGHAHFAHLWGDALWSGPTETWPDRMTDGPVPDGAGPLTVTVEVRRDLDPCLAFAREVVAVDAGDGEAAAAMEATLVAAATASRWEPFEEAPGMAPWCQAEGRPADALGFFAQELTELACALPDGPAVRCFVLGRFGYEGGAHDYATHDVLVFDAPTGIERSLEDLIELAGTDVATATDRVERAVCAIDRATAQAEGATAFECWEVELRQAWPTPEALVFSFAPYEAGPWAVGSRDLHVPWAALAG